MSKVTNTTPSKYLPTLPYTSGLEGCSWSCVFLNDASRKDQTASTDAQREKDPWKALWSPFSGDSSTKRPHSSRLPGHFLLPGKCYHTVQRMPTLLFQYFAHGSHTMNNWQMLLSLSGRCIALCMLFRNGLNSCKGFLLWLVESHSAAWLSGTL